MVIWKDDLSGEAETAAQKSDVPPGILPVAVTVYLTQLVLGDMQHLFQTYQLLERMS